MAQFRDVCLRLLFYNLLLGDQLVRSPGGILLVFFGSAGQNDVYEIGCVDVVLHLRQFFKELDLPVSVPCLF